jgi:micrococcal nuclease
VVLLSNFRITSKRRLISGAFFVCVFYFLSFASVLHARCIPSSVSSLKSEAVQSVLDGDTIRFSEYDLRLQGINTPEMNYHLKPQRPEPYAELATSSVKNLLGNAAVFIEVTGRDKYNRQLGNVWLKSGSDFYMLSESLLKKGLAFQVFESDSVYVDCLARAERHARELNQGVWSARDYWLNAERGGFVLWHDSVKKVAKSKRYFWFSLSTERVVRVPLDWFSRCKTEMLRKDEMIEVRGWVIHRKSTAYEAYMLPLKSCQILLGN